MKIFTNIHNTVHREVGELLESLIPTPNEPVFNPDE